MLATTTSFRRKSPKNAQRLNFGKAPDALPLDNLVQIQTDSFKWFIEKGLKDLFSEISPIRDFIGRDLEIYFLDYYLDEPRFDEVTAKEKNTTYDAPLRVKVRLVNKRLKETKEQEVFLGDIPLMTERGTFIINGIERVTVSQMIRSAGIFFSSEFVRGKNWYSAKVIPNRGAWLELEVDQFGALWIKIDRKRKVSATSLLRAFGYGTDEEILALFSDVDISPDVKFIPLTIAKDPAKTHEEGLIEVYRRLRPGDLATADNAKSLIYSMFFNFDRYDLGEVGRYKFCHRFGIPLGIDKFHLPEERILRKEDLVLILKELIKLQTSQAEADDVDHLGNRRIRAIGELLQNRFRVGLARMERNIKDRMSTMEITAMAPGRLINARPIIAVVREFFMSSQLSQFMDQINPIAELEHKRRLSAMGPGGLSRERAGFDVRDVHRTHYGRICPIATPEGPNIGLVGHLACYARLNDYGFIETPYRRVIHDAANKPSVTMGEILREDVIDPKSQSKADSDLGQGKIIAKKDEKITKNLASELAKLSLPTIPVKPRVTDEIVFLNAFQEEKVITTAATTSVDENGYFKVENAPVRRFGEPAVEDVAKIDFMDVSSRQIISIATSMIPFLEHDDGARALMGTNMQRQAVPLVKPEPPLVGTGVEKEAAINSGRIILSKADGVVTKIEGSRIEIADKKGDVAVYILNKFVRSNALTCLDQHPIVSLGDKVKVGQVLTDGPAIRESEMSLGTNLLVAFMSWDGYNYEDAVILSERLVHDDKFTSIHIENYQIEVRDTKLGPELVTPDIPNVSEEKLKNLDADGVVRIGAEVYSGDILVGKITPKGETELSPEERLLRAIFGDKARDVRDTSLYLEHGEHGKVIDVKTFSRDRGDKLNPGVIKMIQVSVADLRKIQVGDKVAGRHGNKGVISKIVPVEDMPFLPDGTPVDIILSPLGVASRMNLGQILETCFGLAANHFGYRVATPVLDGIPTSVVRDELVRAGFSPDSKTALYDGRTGEAYCQKVAVGYIYIMKLNHMVEDKIHQRSIGPYSLITQQPLGGKAQFGGQRLGEMEVWALEAYGAAHTLQEMLTIKSDDVPGRRKAYESIIKGLPIEKVNIPESFNVLVRELKGLGLDVEVFKDGQIIGIDDKAKSKFIREKNVNKAKKI